jgi:CRP/FNR family transcriptional regulator
MDDRRFDDCSACGLYRLCLPARLSVAPSQRIGDLQIRRLRLARGRVLYRSGDAVDSFYMIRSGCIKEVDETTGPAGVVIHFALPGDLLSLQALGAACSDTTGIALETSHVCSVPWARFNALCATSPAVATDFVRLMARTAGAVRDLLMLIRDRDAVERVSGFLLHLSKRFQVRGLQGGEFRLSMSREDIANYLGLRSETVSRCFSDLAQRGVLRVHAKRVQILQMAGLQQLAFGGGAEG